MSSDVAIRVEGLGKAYTIRHQQSDHVTLAQVALARARHPFRRHAREEFWALKDVDFEVRQGEVLGVIGRNGAGKSTLLKLLTRITGPTTGTIDLWGRVGSLLEVGTGFHPELTGRENVYLNGSILGMSRKEIDRQFDAIVDFAGVEKFLDTPVKRYSSGLYVRLAFAVAAHLDSDILLLDEVLAVGDGDFQKKCFEKVSSLAGGGRAVILVSHNLNAVRQFTDRSLLLDAGHVVADGPTDSVLGMYRSGEVQTATVDTSDLRRFDRSWGSEVRITQVSVNQDAAIVQPNEPLRIGIDVRSSSPFPSLRVSIQIDSIATGPVGLVHTPPSVDLLAGHNHLELTLPNPMLAPGKYSVGLSIGTGGTFSEVRNLDALAATAVFEVVAWVDLEGRPGLWHSEWGAIHYPEVHVTTSSTNASTAAPHLERSS